MRDVPDRAVFTVIRHGGQWAVEHAGEYFGHSADKEIAKGQIDDACRKILSNPVIEDYRFEIE